MPDLREDIVNKSFFQFLNKGYKACSLKDLEQATGLTKGAFYYYFRNKEEILKAGIQKYLSVASEMSEAEFLKIRSLREYIGEIEKELWSITIPMNGLSLDRLSGICTMPKTVVIPSMKMRIKMKFMNRQCNGEEETYEQKM